MRLAFVYPVQNVCSFAFTKAIAEQNSREGAILPPLGIAYLAAILEQKHTVRIIDANALRLSINKVVSELSAFQPEVLLFSLITSNFPNDLHWIKEIKRRIDVPVVVGGPQSSLYPAEVLAFDCIDFSVIGQAWESLPALIECLEAKGDVEAVSGIAFRKNGSLTITGTKKSAITIDDVPFPARHLLPNGNYTTILSKKRPITAMMSSSGCPFACIYCGADQDIVFRDPMNVVDEMEECVRKYGIKEILFYDDVFAVDKKRAAAICEDILRRKLDVTWSIRTRPDCVDEDIIKLFARAGCVRINYGVESADPRILRSVKRDISFGMIRDVVRWAKREGISVFGFFIIGLPGETRESIMGTIKTAKELDLDYAQFSKVVPAPQTELYRTMQKEVGGDFWRDYTLGKENIGNLMPVGSQVSPEELTSWLKKAYRDFYFRPKYIVRTLRKIESFRELRGLISSAWSLR
ncbi:B12-binding domain-containing radical SAM protein [Candidatus Omnitrophota bacterium]